MWFPITRLLSLEFLNQTAQLLRADVWEIVALWYLVNTPNSKAWYTWAFPIYAIASEPTSRTLYYILRHFWQNLSICRLRKHVSDCSNVSSGADIRKERIQTEPKLQDDNPRVSSQAIFSQRGAVIYLSPFDHRWVLITEHQVNLDRARSQGTYLTWLTQEWASLNTSDSGPFRAEFSVRQSGFSKIRDCWVERYLSHQWALHLLVKGSRWESCKIVHWLYLMWTFGHVA